MAVYCYCSTTCNVKWNKYGMVTNLMILLNINTGFYHIYWCNVAPTTGRLSLASEFVASVSCMVKWWLNNERFCPIPIFNSILYSRLINMNIHVVVHKTNNWHLLQKQPSYIDNKNKKTQKNTYLYDFTSAWFNVWPLFPNPISPYATACIGKTTNHRNRNVVCSIMCEQPECTKTYTCIGETKQKIRASISQHHRPSTGKALQSAVFTHVEAMEHYRCNNILVLDREKRWREGIYLRKGWKLKSVWSAHRAHKVTCWWKPTGCGCNITLIDIVRPINVFFFFMILDTIGWIIIYII